MGKGSFFAELKRRNVLRAAAFYASACWLLIQVAAQLFPIFHVPDWVLKWVVLAAFLGAPFALAFAWFYEFTSEGVRAESDLEADTTVIRYTGRRLDRWIIAVLSLAVVLLLANTFILHKTADAAADIPDKSIAVMPFDNLSAEKENAYFATGMQDEILTRLAGIHDLKVISRNSTKQYESRPANLKEVSAQLGVATVLEGSVQKVGSRALINLQLVDARNDKQLWGESYDRDLKDIFGVQRDVSEKVAEALKAQLLPAESKRLANVPTQDTEAYDLYLRAGAHFILAEQSVLAAREMPLAIDLYREAFAKDPKFALAAAMEGQAQMRMYWFGPDRTEQRLAAAKDATDKALALQPDLGEAHVARALYLYWGHHDYVPALAELETAGKSMPNNSYVPFIAAAITRRQGHWDDAARGMLRAIQLDPRSAEAHEGLGLTYARMRRYADADAAFVLDAQFSKHPDSAMAARALITTVPWKGDVEPLRSALAKIKPGSDDYAANANRFYMLAWWTRDWKAAIRVASEDQAALWVDLDNVALPRKLFLAWALTASGDDAKAKPIYTEVRDDMKAAVAQRPDDENVHLALAFAAAGMELKDEAIAEARKAAALVPVERDALSGPAYQAWLGKLYARVGENAQALDVMTRLLAIPAGVVASPALLRVDPFWDPLRKDPRFQKLVANAPPPVAKGATGGRP